MPRSRNTYDVRLPSGSTESSPGSGRVLGVGAGAVALVDLGRADDQLVADGVVVGEAIEAHLGAGRGRWSCDGKKRLCSTSTITVTGPGPRRWHGRLFRRLRQALPPTTKTRAHAGAAAPRTGSPGPAPLAPLCTRRRAIDGPSRPRRRALPAPTPVPTRRPRRARGGATRTGTPGRGRLRRRRSMARGRGSADTARS